MKTTIPIDCYNHTVPDNPNIVGTIVPHMGRWGMTNGWKIIEIYETEDYTDRHDMEERGQRLDLP